MVIASELRKKGLRVKRPHAIPIVFDGLQFEAGFQADLIVEDKVIVEVKPVADLSPVHKKQLLTYLRLANKKLGLLINFSEILIKNGITRVVNGLRD